MSIERKLLQANGTDETQTITPSKQASHKPLLDKRRCTNSPTFHFHWNKGELVTEWHTWDRRPLSKTNKKPDRIFSFGSWNLERGLNETNPLNKHNDSWCAMAGWMSAKDRWSTCSPFWKKLDTKYKSRTSLTLCVYNFVNYSSARFTFQAVTVGWNLKKIYKLFVEKFLKIVRVIWKDFRKTSFLCAKNKNVRKAFSIQEVEEYSEKRRSWFCENGSIKPIKPLIALKVIVFFHSIHHCVVFVCFFVDVQTFDRSHCLRGFIHVLNQIFRFINLVGLVKRGSDFWVIWRLLLDE